MSSAVQRGMQRTSDVPQGRLWFGLLGGGAAWLVHLVLAYLIGEFGCQSGLDEQRFAGLSLVAWLVLLATLVTVLLAAVATLVSWRRLRHVASDSHSLAASTARAGLMTSGAFVVFILFETIPIFYYLHRC